MENKWTRLLEATLTSLDRMTSNASETSSSMKPKKSVHASELAMGTVHSRVAHSATEPRFLHWLQNWLAIGQNASKPDNAFCNDLKDIIELSRASAAIVAARPGLLNEDKLNMTVSLNTTHAIKVISTSVPTTQTTHKPTTTFMPFLGVRVVDEMGGDVFENPNAAQSIAKNSTINSVRLNLQRQPTKKAFKPQTEKLPIARGEFTSAKTSTTPPSTRKPLPTVQNAVPVYSEEPDVEKTTYVPTWRRTTTPSKP